MRVRVLVATILATAVLDGSSHADPAIVPPALRDVNGKVVDVAALASSQRLVFVTLKGSWCPVCRAQLQRLGRLLPHLRACGATFIVLAPGATDALAAVARDTSFPFPFVADDALAVAASAGLVTKPDELVPAFFVVNAAREVVWEQRGRADGAFGDDELLRYLGCPRPTEKDLQARGQASTATASARRSVRDVFAAPHPRSTASSSHA